MTTTDTAVSGRPPPRAKWEAPSCCHSEACDADEDLGTFASLKDHTWLKLGISIVIAGQSMVWGLALNLTPPPFGSAPYLALHGLLIGSALLVMLLLSGPLFRAAYTQIRTLRPGIEMLFLLSLCGALGGSLHSSLTGDGLTYYEVVAFVVIIYTFGGRLGAVSRDRAFAEIDKLRSLFDRVMRLSEDGAISSVSISELSPGDKVVVNPGGAIAVDGVIEEGYGFIKETPITGEPLPVLRGTGDRVSAGTWSIDASLRILPDHPYAPRIIDQIMQEVDTAARKTESTHQIRAAHWIRHFVILVALAALISGLAWGFVNSPLKGWITAMSVLLVACPCALGIATPLAVWSGIWRLSEIGLISRTPRIIDALAHTRHLFFDKTGTLTEAGMRIRTIRIHHAEGWNREQVLALAKALESGIDHPVARAIATIPESVEMAIRSQASRIRNRRWIPGTGIEAQYLKDADKSVDPLIVRLGPPDWVGANGRAKLPTQDAPGHLHALAIGDTLLAEFETSESLRPDIDALFHELNGMGILSTILTGDPNPRIPAFKGVSIRFGLKPHDKGEILGIAAERGEEPMFVGDGINDLPAMTRAPASIAIQDSSAPLTLSNATAILRGASPLPLAQAIRISRRIHRTLQSNLVFAACYNTVGIGIAAAGHLHPVAAALVMVISSLTVTWRAARSTAR